MEFRKIQTIAFFSLLIGVSAIFIRMIYPYIFAIFWAAVVAALFYPVYTYILKKIKNENIASATTVIIVLLVVLLPLAGVLALVVRQTVGLYDTVKNPKTIEIARETTENILKQPYVEGIFGEINLEEKIQTASSSITQTGLQWLTVGTKSTINTIINLLIMIYALYYLFKDGKGWLKRIMLLLPFGDKNEKALFDKFVSTSKATLKGTVLLGGLQGTLGGILFFLIGIPSAAFWGLIMIVLSIIPAVGSFIVWFPVAIYLFATGQLWQGIVLTIGGILIGILDNLLRPPLVGKDIEMHPILILFSTIGGLGLFGISGVVIGPIFAAFFLGVLDMYEKKYKKQLNSSTT